MKTSFTRSLAAAIFIAAGSISAFADGNININSPNDDQTNGWTFSSSTLTITTDGTYTITGSTTTNRIVVQSGVKDCNITLKDVNINVSDIDGACAFDMSGAAVNLTLTGSNELKSGRNKAGLQVPEGATLVIDGAGSLVATGGDDGAGIGGGYGSSYGGAGGTITISDGTVTANGGDSGAGIGGGGSSYGGAGGTITISGGTVTANGGDSGAAGIGGGRGIGTLGGAGGTISISGGTVTATGSAGGAGIGGGSKALTGGNISISGGTVTATSGSGVNNPAGIGGGGGKAPYGVVTITGGSVKMSNHNGPQPTSDGITPVYLNTLAIGNPNGAPITAGSIGGVDCDKTPDPQNGVYGIKDVKTDADGKVYFYLPASTSEETIQLTTGNASYGVRYTRAANTSYTQTPSGPDLVVSGINAYNPAYVAWSGDTLTFLQGGTYAVSMRTGVDVTTNKIKVDSGVTASITLSGVNIDVSGTDSACAFDMSGATVNLTLTGSNALKSGRYKAGLQAPKGATLVIDGKGSLVATGGNNGAGIGGGSNGSNNTIGDDGGNISISGGTVTATGSSTAAGIGGGGGGGGGGGNISISGGTVTANGGSYGGAGIGGGGYGAGGAISISGGTVMANGGGTIICGAGIGGGRNGAGGAISISGGTVTANGGGHFTSAGIGGGNSSANSGVVVITGGSVKINNHNGPQPTSNGTTPVYLNILTVGDPAVPDGTPITAGSINGISCADTANASAGVYGIKGVETDNNGKVYFYLPTSSSNELVKLTANDTVYGKNYIRSADHSNAQTLVVLYDITLSEAVAYSFSAASYGYAPALLNVTITNAGYNATGELAVALSGENYDQFTLSPATISSIAADGTGSFTVAPKAGLTIGTYTATVTVTGGNDISAAFDVSFTVDKKDIAIHSAVVDAKIYDGTTTATVTSVTFNGLENSDSLVFDTDYEVTAAFTDPNAGNDDRTVQMTVALKSTDRANNYKLTNGTDWSLVNQSITPATLTVTPNGGQEKVYGQADPLPFTFAVSGWQHGDEVDSASIITGALIRVLGDSVGTYAITQGNLSAGSNYDVKFIEDTTFAITPAALTVTPNGGQTKVYGEADPAFTFTVSGWQNGEKKDSASIIAGALSRDAGSNVGTYAITQNDLSEMSGNYDIDFAAGVQFTIAPSRQEISFAPAERLLVENNFYLLTATVSTSGGAPALPPLFRSSNEAVAAVSGDTLWLKQPGTVTVTAYVAPNSNYENADEVSRDVSLLTNLLDFDTYVIVKLRCVMVYNNRLLSGDGYTVGAFRWYGNGELLATGSTYALDAAWLTFSPDVAYHFEIDTPEGTIRSTDKVFDFSTGVADVEGSNRLLLYPNPLPPGATLNVHTGAWGAGNRELLIYSAAGNLVLRQRFSGAFVTLPFAAPAGIYFLRVGGMSGKIMVD